MSKRINKQNQDAQGEKIRRQNEKDRAEIERKRKIIEDELKTVPILKWRSMKIALVVLKERSISYADEVLDPLALIWSMGPAQLNINYTRTDLARNTAAMKLLGSDFTHLVMLDIDHKHPIDIISRLARWFLMDKYIPENGIRKNIQVVGGLNFRRSSPHDPCCHLFGKDGNIYAPAAWTDGLLKVDAIGTGSIMIAKEVFEIIPPPWFYNVYDRTWENVFPGEDMGFSRNCNKYGIGMYVDTTTTSEHITTQKIGVDEFRKAISDKGMVVTQFSEEEMK